MGGFHNERKSNEPAPRIVSRNPDRNEEARRVDRGVGFDSFLGGCQWRGDGDEARGGGG